MLYWNCPSCYYWYGRTGSQHVPSDKTSYTKSYLQGERTYFFAVHAETISGIGENATTSVAVNRNFAQVRNLTANVNKNTMTVKWNPPSDIDLKDIKVCIYREMVFWVCLLTAQIIYKKPQLTILKKSTENKIIYKINKK